MIGWGAEVGWNGRGGGRAIGRAARMLSALLALGLASGALAATCHVYRVTVQGVVANNFGQQQVSVTQFALWRDQGFRGNPVEFGLFVTHDLNAQAQVGEIVLMTNSAFSPNPGVSSQAFDLAAVALVGNGARFQLDAGASLILPPTNVMVTPGVGNAPGGLGGLEFLPGAGGALGRQIGQAFILQTAFAYPRGGSGYFVLPDDVSIAGEFSITGSGIDTSTFEGIFQGSFAGTYLGGQPC